MPQRSLAVVPEFPQNNSKGFFPNKSRFTFEPSSIVILSLCKTVTPSCFTIFRVVLTSSQFDKFLTYIIFLNKSGNSATLCEIDLSPEK